jgi:hypothetical protein
MCAIWTAVIGFAGFVVGGGSHSGDDVTAGGDR